MKPVFLLLRLLRAGAGSSGRTDILGTQSAGRKWESRHAIGYKSSKTYGTNELIGKAKVVMERVSILGLLLWLLLPFYMGSSGQADCVS